MHRNSSIEEYFSGLNYLGVNRISVGAQSFDDTSLKKTVGRTVLQKLSRFLWRCAKFLQM